MKVLPAVGAGALIAALVVGVPTAAAAQVDNYETVLASTSIGVSDTVAAYDVNCPTGKVALGGGGSAIQSGAVWVTEYSRPASNSGVISVWQVQFQKLSGTPSVTGTLNVRVICATP